MLHCVPLQLSQPERNHTTYPSLTVHSRYHHIRGNSLILDLGVNPLSYISHQPLSSRYSLGFVPVVSFVLLGLIYNGKIMKREIRPSKQREHNSNKEGKEVKKNKAQTTKKRALLNFTYLLCLCSLCFSLFFTTHLSLHSFHSFSRVFLFIEMKTSGAKGEREARVSFN